MLPFLKPKQMATLIRSRRGDKSQDLAPEIVAQDDAMPDGLMASCEEIIKAIEDKSAHGLSVALRKAFEACDSDGYEEENQ